MGESTGRIGLQKMLAALRKQLVDSIIASQTEGLRFEVGEITMKFHIEDLRKHPQDKKFGSSH